MSHYTLLSGVDTTTISSRCPICNSTTLYTASEAMHFIATDESICCVRPKPCRDIYVKGLWELWHRAQVWGRDNGMTIASKQYIFDKYITDVGV